MKDLLPLLLLGLSPALWAQGDIQTLDIDWGSAQRYEHELALVPGGAVEACSPLAKGQRVHWTFHADANLSFALLHRVGKRAYYADRRQRTRSLQGEFNPSQAVRYCWSWTNAGSQSVQLAFMLRH